jgi:hypothetical protein
MVDPIKGTPPPAPAAPPVAGDAKGGPPGGPPPGSAAKVTAPKFGGLRGGKGRKDGLVPGTPEAVEADRKRDAERKRKERQPDPAPLPGAARPPEGVFCSPSAPGDALAAVPGPEGAPVVPWDAAQLKDVFGLLIPAAEELSLAQVRGKCQKARLPVEVIREIEADCKWKDQTRKGFEFSGPRVAAKWLNRFGVPSGTQDEIVFLTCAAIVLKSHIQVLKRLDELAAKANVPTSKTPETPPENKKGTA